MKLLTCLVFGGLLAAAGCLPDSFMNKEVVAEKPAKEASQTLGRPHNYVTPDQVDDKNFRDKEKVLRRELQMDEEDAERAALPVKK
jgi:hypothetical protein